MRFVCDHCGEEFNETIEIKHIFSSETLPDGTGIDKWEMINVPPCHHEATFTEIDDVKTPAGYLCKDFADGWIFYDKLENAEMHSKVTGCLMRPVYFGEAEDDLKTQ